jgi:hypothetical protein
MRSSLFRNLVNRAQHQRPWAVLVPAVPSLYVAFEKPGMPRIISLNAASWTAFAASLSENPRTSRSSFSGQSFRWRFTSRGKTSTSQSTTAPFARREGPYRISISLSHNACFLKSFARSRSMRSFPPYRPTLWNHPAAGVARSHRHHLHTRIRVASER